MTDSSTGCDWPDIVDLAECARAIQKHGGEIAVRPFFLDHVKYRISIPAFFVVNKSFQKACKEFVQEYAKWRAKNERS